MLKTCLLISKLSQPCDWKLPFLGYKDTLIDKLLSSHLCQGILLPPTLRTYSVILSTVEGKGIFVPSKHRKSISKWHGLLTQENEVLKIHMFNVPTLLRWGYEVVQFFVALHYKSEGRGFDSRWSNWKFSLTLSFPLGSTQPLTETSTRGISLELKATGP